MDYYFPFLVVGLLPLLPAVMATITMPTPTTKSQDSEAISVVSLLKIPGIVIMSLAVFVFFGIPVMLEPTLAPHLEPHGLSISLIGLVFFIMPLTFTIATPIFGKLVGCVEYRLPFMIIATFGMGLSCLFLGPMPLFGIKPYETLWPTLVSLGALGIFWAAAMVPSYDKFVHYATYALPNVDHEILMGTLGSLIFMMPAAGEFFGPVLAGSIFDAYGFQWTMTMAGLVCIFTGIILSLTFIIFGEKEVKCGQCPVTNTRKSEEKESLLGPANEALFDPYSGIGNNNEKSTYSPEARSNFVLY